MKKILRLSINPADLTLEKVEEFMELLDSVDMEDEAAQLRQYLVDNGHL